MNTPSLSRRSLLIAGGALALTAPAARAFADDSDPQPADPTTGTGPADPDADGPVATDAYYPTYGDTSYQVDTYVVNNSYSTNTAAIWGSTQLVGKLLKATTTLYVDTTLNVTGATVNDTKVTCTKVNNRKWKLTGVPTMSAGSALTIQVSYGASYPGQVWAASDRASQIGLNGYVATPNKGIVTIGEPTAAVYWMVCNDRLDDKATYDVTLTCPPDKTMLAAGQKVGAQTTNSGGWISQRFVLDKASSTYHPFIAIGDYTVRTTTATIGSVSVPFLSAVGNTVSTTTQNNAWSALSIVPSVLNYYTSRFGAYPFTSAGSVVVDGTFDILGQECAGRPVYTYDSLSQALIAHECAHMWFGDCITATKWSDVAFIHEGMAVLSQWDYQYKYLNGLSPNTRAHNWWSSNNQSLANPGAGNEFSNVAYVRAPVAMNSIRNVMGSTNFDAALRDMLTTYRYSNLSTSQFQAMMQKHSTTSLDAVFKAWVYSTSTPAQTAANGY